MIRLWDVHAPASAKKNGNSGAIMEERGRCLLIMEPSASAAAHVAAFSLDGKRLLTGTHTLSYVHTHCHSHTNSLKGAHLRVCTHIIIHRVCHMRTSFFCFLSLSRSLDRSFFFSFSFCQEESVAPFWSGTFAHFYHNINNKMVTTDKGTVSKTDMQTRWGRYVLHVLIITLTFTLRPSPTPSHSPTLSIKRSNNNTPEY